MKEILRANGNDSHKKLTKKEPNENCVERLHYWSIHVKEKKGIDKA
jgi:hypothetical protein